MKSRLILPTFCLAAACLVAVGIFAFTHIPNERVPRLFLRFGDDKFRHVLSYALFSALLLVGLRPWLPKLVKSFVWVVVIGTVFSAIDELTQPWAGRTCSLLDFLASLGGTLLGGSLVLVIAAVAALFFRSRLVSAIVNPADFVPKRVSSSGASTDTTDARTNPDRASVNPTRPATSPAYVLAPSVTGKTVAPLRKRFLKFLGVGAALLVLLAGLGFAFPQWFLCVEHGDVKADILIVPGGAGGERAKWAAQLYANGAAPRILLTGAGDYRGHRAILLAAGVPPDAILLETRSTTTRENAEFSARLLKEQGIKTAIVATSWYHSRRALTAFEHFAPGIQFYSCPSHYAYARADWKKAGIGRFVWAEYPKLAGYWLRHGISPF